MKHILIVNGPNLNLLGIRQPDIYGTRTMEDVVSELRFEFPDIEIDLYQSNHEGDLIDRLHEAGFGNDKTDGIVLNAGGLTHTSVALADAVAAIPTPVVEVHISNIYGRDSFRQHSFLSSVCLGSISGFGTDVYRLAVSAILKHTNG